MKYFRFLSVIIILFCNCKKDEIIPGKADTDILSAARSKDNSSLELVYKDSL